MTTSKTQNCRLKASVLIRGLIWGFVELSVLTEATSEDFNLEFSSLGMTLELKTGFRINRIEWSLGLKEGFTNDTLELFTLMTHWVYLRLSRAQ